MTRGSRSPFALAAAITCIAGSTILTATDVSAASRQWTSADGIKISAEFVRMEGELVVLRKADATLVTIPASQLNAVDREIIAVASSIAGKPTDSKKTATRRWTSTSGDTVDARLVRKEGDALVLEKLDATLVTIPIASLSAADQALAQSNGSGAGSPPTRNWSSTDGAKIEASFVRLEGNNAILRDAKSNEMVIVELAKLTPKDRSIARAAAGTGSAPQTSQAPQTPSAKMKKWKSVDGFAIEGQFIKVDGDLVVLRDRSNKLISIPINQLSAADRKTLPSPDSGLFPPEE